MIDTNVAIAASGRNTHASENCQNVCKELLGQCNELHIVIDDIGLILEEYANKLNHSGKPSIGDAFFRYVKNHQYSIDKIQRVPITPINDETRGFNELPENQLDKSDRKFLTTAVVAQATIVNATDSDWQEQQNLLNSLSINLKQLCPEHSCK